MFCIDQNNLFGNFLEFLTAGSLPRFQMHTYLYDIPYCIRNIHTISYFTGIVRIEVKPDLKRKTYTDISCSQHITTILHFPLILSSIYRLLQLCLALSAGCTVLAAAATVTSNSIMSLPDPPHPELDVDLPNTLFALPSSLGSLHGPPMSTGGGGGRF